MANRRVPYRPIQYLGWAGAYATLRSWGLAHTEAANISSHWWQSRRWEQVERRFAESGEFKELLAVCDVRLSSSGRLRLDEERKVTLSRRLPQDEILMLEQTQQEFSQALERDLAEFVRERYKLLLGPLAQEEQAKAKGRKSRTKA